MHTDNQVNELASDFNQLGQNTHPKKWSFLGPVHRFFFAKKLTAEYNDDKKRPLNDNSKPLNILTNKSASLMEDAYASYCLTECCPHRKPSFRFKIIKHKGKKILYVGAKAECTGNELAVLIKFCNWLQKPKLTSLHVNSGAHGGFNEEDEVYYEPEPEFFERDKKLLKRLAQKINLPVSIHQITYEDGPTYDVEAET